VHLADPVEQPRDPVAQDQRQEDRDARPEAGQQHFGDDVRADEVHDKADRGQDQSGDEDRATDLLGVTALGADGGHRRHE
jgi:hypothetical protein